MSYGTGHVTPPEAARLVDDPTRHKILGVTLQLLPWAMINKPTLSPTLKRYKKRPHTTGKAAPARMKV